MKNNIITVLILFILLGCNNPTSTTQDSKSNEKEAKASEKIALKYLFDKLDKLPNASLKNDEILIGDTSIRINIEGEFEEFKDNNWLYGANITTTYKTDKAQKIDAGTIGIGSTKDEAVKVFLEEWFGTFGIPFTNMLNGKNGVIVTNLKVFPGLMGIRGNLPKNTWLMGDDEMVKKIISQIQDQIRIKTGELLPVDIKLMIGMKGLVNGECRIDNQVSKELLDELKKLNWPSTEVPFMFKQYYLIEKIGF